MNFPKAFSLSDCRAILIGASKRAEKEEVLEVHLVFQAEDPRAGANDKPYRIDVGARIIPTGHSEVTYFIVLGEEKSDNEWNIIRKFHFDLESESSESEPKPTLHQQYAGTLPPILAPYYSTESYELTRPDKSKPRIPCLPRSFALLLHHALLEFHPSDEQLRNFLHSPEWINVVKESEDAILTPYFSFCADWIAKTGNRSKSLLSHFYCL